MFGDEPCGNYNRILLSSVLSRSHKPDDIFINPMSWYAARGITLHAGQRVETIDLRAERVVASGGLSERYDKLDYRDRQQPGDSTACERARRARRLQTRRLRVSHARRLRAHHAFRRHGSPRSRHRRRAAWSGGGPRSPELGPRNARHSPDAAPDGNAARPGCRRRPSTPVRADGSRDTPRHADDRRDRQRSRRRAWHSRMACPWIAISS